MRSWIAVLISWLFLANAAVMADARTAAPRAAGEAAPRAAAVVTDPGPAAADVAPTYA